MATRRYTRRRRNTGALLVNPRRRRRSKRKSSARSMLSRLRRRRSSTSKRKRSNAAKKAAATRRRNASARSRAAKKAAATRRRRAASRRRNGTKRGGIRKTSRRAYMRRKPTRRRRATGRKYTRRRNTGVMTGLQTSLKKVPVVGGMLADVVGLGTPAAFGAISILPIEMGLKAGGRYLPERLQAVSFTIGGLIMGAVAKRFLPAGKFRDQISVALATAGGAVDFYRWRQGQTTVAAMEVAESATAGFGSLEVMSGFGELEVMSGYGGGHHHHGYGELEVMAGYGDMGYDVVNFDSAGAGTSLGAYLSDASMADAYYSGSDFGAAERTAALAGSRRFMRRFPSPIGRRGRIHRLRTTGSSRSQPSANAGRQGCGKKWMICLVGFPNFQKIAALPGKERRRVIAALRKQAIESLPDMLETDNDSWDPETANGSTDGYGALMYAGGY